MSDNTIKHLHFETSQKSLWELLPTGKMQLVRLRVNEIFYSLQGEGRFTGVPAVFLRFSGCNLKCWFCDTDFTLYTEMTEEEIVAEVSKFEARHIVITGGEPTLQLTASLCDKLHQAGFFIQIETNGTNPLNNIKVDWITCSPKGAPVRLEHIDELKVVYEEQDMSVYDAFKASEYRLQPCATGDKDRDKKIMSETISYCLTHPKWHLSLQTHKIIGVQ